MKYGKEVKKPKAVKGPKPKASGTKMVNKYGINTFTGDMGTLCSDTY
jgi:hypothetical protein